MSTKSPRGVTVGGELRKWRDARGMSQRKLGECIGKSHVTIGRYERGELMPTSEQLTAMLTKLDVPIEEREQVVALARTTANSRWLAVGMPEQQQQLGALLDLERDASRITETTPLVIPGLLQTEDYVRAVMAHGVPPSEITTRVAVRVGRREALRRKNPAQLHALIGEAALRANVGGAAVMVEQLRWLLQVAEWPTVALQVIPLDTDWTPAMEGAFVLVDFPDPDAQSIVHLETRISGLFVDEPEHVEAYRAAAEAVSKVAMNPSDSMGFIADIITGKETTE